MELHTEKRIAPLLLHKVPITQKSMRKLSLRFYQSKNAHSSK